MPALGGSSTLSVGMGPASYAQGFARCAGESAAPELWPGLTGLWVPNLGITGARLPDLSGHHRDFVSSAQLWGITRRGWVYPGVGVAHAVNALRTTNDIAINNPRWSMVWDLVWDAVAVWQPIFRWDCTNDTDLRSGAATTAVNFRYYVTGVGHKNLNVVGGATAGERVVIVVTYGSGTGGCKIYTDGVLRDSDDAAAVVDTAGFSSIQMNHAIGSSCSLNLGAAYNRELSAAVVQSLSRDPLALVRLRDDVR